ncbi:hypothetical protein [Corynebacterium anserum]|uniref:Uncharacterized protein n=1 Tax=Corynebacterium anserum TaxID=2684406 RepID=A0A7G7YN97_9CORY|nr:hypothetical protein [Corynebacterium anserum]MBC2681516.1 hypothetical protein [Corynebacterium anserum]QNH95967.1 hypothetical protein GP473_04120 [Corynebacterium anserum]
MADIEVHLVGRLSASGLSDRRLDVLLFVTPDNSQMLPVWIPELADLGGRPTDAEILATTLSTSEYGDPWFAEIATNSRGQMTAGLKQGKRYIDVRPSTLEAAWYAGVLFDIRVKEAVTPALLPVNPEFIAELKELLRQAQTEESEDGNVWSELAKENDLPLHEGKDPVLTWQGLPIAACPDVADEFADMWKALGLSEDLGDWLGSEEE